MTVLPVEFLLICVNQQACNATQRNCETCAQDPPDVGDRVEEPGGPAKPRMGALYDPSTRYLNKLNQN